MIGSDIYDLTAVSGAPIEKLSEFAKVRERFEEEFLSFVRRKKIKAIRQVIREDLQSTTLADNLTFLNQVAKRVDESAILERSNAFIALNPRLMV